MSFWDSKTESLWDSPATPTPFLRQPTNTPASTPSLKINTNNSMKTSTPAFKVGPDTFDIAKSAGQIAKDAFIGGDQTTGGILRNTVIGIPKATVEVGKNIVTGLKDQVVNPDAEQKSFESQMLPYAGGGGFLDKVTAPGVATARFITRVVNPGLRPLANDLAEIRYINEKGGLADQVAAGKIPASYLDELAVLHKTAPQIVGDVAQAVLTAYAGGEGANLAEGGVKSSFLNAFKTGAASGLQTGEIFGLSQALSAGQTNPFEILGTVGTSGVAGGILGGLISGFIPATSEVVAKAREAKVLYDSLSPMERQAGKIRNPLFNTKVVDNFTKDELIQAIDYLRGAKEFNKKMESNISYLAERYGISQDLPTSKIADKFQYLVEQTKTLSLDERKVISGSSQELPQEKTATKLPEEGSSTQKSLAQKSPEKLKTTSTEPSIKNSEFSYDSKIPQDFNPDKYVMEQVAKRETAQKIGGLNTVEKFSSLLEEFKKKSVDFTAPIEDLLYSATKKNDIKLLPSEDIHNQIDRALRAPTLAGQFAKDHGIIDVIKHVDAPEKLDQYLIAKHAIELDNRGVTTGRNIAADSALIEAYAPKYETMARMITNYAEKLLKYSVRSGLVSDELARVLRARYPDYVPFSRVFNELEKAHGYGTNAVASLSKQTAVQKIIGSEREIESPIQSLLGKTYEVFNQGEKNLAGKMLAGYERLPGNPFELKELKPGESAPHTISFIDNGEKRTFSTTKEVAIAAKTLDVQQLNILGKILAAPVRVAKVGITGIYPPFIAANLVKDQVTAFANSSHRLQTSILNPVNFVRSLFSAVTHDALYQEMVRAGGGGTSFDIARNQAKSTIESIRANRNPISKIQYTVTHPSELLRIAENIVNRGEEATRIQQYLGTKKGLLKEGMVESEAMIGGARAARENTVNFARHGEWGKVLNSAFLYLNAGIQGSRTLLRNLKEHPVRTSTGIAVSGLFPVAMATVWNLSDPTRRKAYDDIAEYEKENNIIIVPPNPTQDEKGRWNVIKIPLSQEINGIVSMARRPLEAIAGSKPLAFKDFSDAILGTVSPVKPDQGSLLSTFTPQAIKPTIEGITNTNLFTGIPQVPKSLEGLPPEDQVKAYTSGSARIIGGKLNVSPIKVEEWIKGTFGGLGSVAVNAVDEVLAHTGTIPKDQIGGQSILDGITARFMKARGGQSDQAEVSTLQDLVQNQAGDRHNLKLEAEKLDSALKDMPKDVANERVKEIQKNNPELFKKLQDVVKERKLNLDYSEKLMIQLGVTNGARAKYIDSQILKLPSSEERNAYLQELIGKKIVTDEVLQQLKKLRGK